MHFAVSIEVGERRMQGNVGAGESLAALHYERVKRTSYVKSILRLRGTPEAVGGFAVTSIMEGLF